MTRLMLVLRVLRALGASRTAYALVGLYAVVCAVLWLVSHGIIAPDGSMDLRLWINGRIFDLPKFQAWWAAGGGGAVLAGIGLYGRAMARGPLTQGGPSRDAQLGTLLQGVQAMLAAAAPQPAAEPSQSESPQPQPEPVALHPAGLRQTAATLVAAAGLGKIGGQE